MFIRLVSTGIWFDAIAVLLLDTRALKCACPSVILKILHFHNRLFSNASFLSVFYMVSLDNWPQQINSFDGISDISHWAAL